jgi:hypothetical protein
MKKSLYTNRFNDKKKFRCSKNNGYYITPSQNFHPLGLFKDKYSKELKFPTLFYGQPQQFFKSFPYQQIA